MERKRIHVSLLCCVTSYLIASPPPPPPAAPGFGDAFKREMEAPQESASNRAPMPEESTEKTEEPSFDRSAFGTPEETSTDAPERSVSASFAPRQPVTPSNITPERESEPTFGQPPAEENGPESVPSFSSPFEPTGAEDQQQDQSSEQEAYDSGTNTVYNAAQMQQAEEAIDQQDATVQEGIDSFDVEGSGNWLLKRVWWEKTEEVYEATKQIFNQVLDTRTNFITARNALDRELDIFYGEMGLEQGPLYDIITHILSLMEKKRASQGDVLSVKEEDLVKRTQEKEQVLMQLKADIKGIQAVEEKLDQALNTLFKQIDVCNEYEQRAWTNFKSIARELNDQEARKSYYQTEALLGDIKKIQTYLNGPFTTYFEQTVQVAREYAQKITTNMQNLRNQGIDLQKEALRLENERDEPQPKPKTTKEVVKEKEKSGFFGGIMQFFRSLFSSMLSWFSSAETKVKVRTKKIEQGVVHDVKSVAGRAGQALEDFAQDDQIASKKR